MAGYSYREKKAKEKAAIENRFANCYSYVISRESVLLLKKEWCCTQPQ